MVRFKASKYTIQLQKTTIGQIELRNSNKHFKLTYGKYRITESSSIIKSNRYTFRPIQRKQRKQTSIKYEGLQSAQIKSTRNYGRTNSA